MTFFTPSPLPLNLRSCRIYPSNPFSAGKANEEYSLPLKVAAGARANAVVVDNVETAKESLEYLRQNQYGIATLLPMDKIKTIEKFYGDELKSGEHRWIGDVKKWSVAITNSSVEYGYAFTVGTTMYLPFDYL